MPCVSKASIEGQQYGPVEDRAADIAGYTVNWVSTSQDVDGTPLLEGLPDDQCHCTHLGYVLKGSISFKYGDREEVFNEGDAYIVTPGHTPKMSAGAEFFQFTDAEDLKVTEEVMMANARRLMSA